MVTIILVEPETAGNIGSVARSMRNFGQSKLILINPKCDHQSLEAIKFAKHAGVILKKAKVIKTKDLKRSLLGFHPIIATTSKLGTDYNLNRSPLTPVELSGTLKKHRKVALLFGRESSGLTNEELSIADFMVSIPSSKKYPALNLSHSVSIILYELHKHQKNITSHFKSASEMDKDQIQKMFGEIFSELKFATPSKRKTQQVVWKRIMGKAFLTKREAFAVMGVLRKIKEKLK